MTVPGEWVTCRLGDSPLIHSVRVESIIFSPMPQGREVNWKSLRGTFDGKPIHLLEGEVIDHVPLHLRCAAVEHFRRALGERLLDQIRRWHQRDPGRWWVIRHFTTGMGIRNLLRQDGFGESRLGVANLDDVYIPLLEEAAHLGAVRPTLGWQLRRRLARLWGRFSTL